MTEREKLSNSDIDDPFITAAALADWVAATLCMRGIDEIGRWQALDRWMQVELYRAVHLQKAVARWRPLGDYAPPCVSRVPRDSAQSCGVDLAFVRSRDAVPERTLWMGLNDLGRHIYFVDANAKDLGGTLAALRGLDREATLARWKTLPSRAWGTRRAGDWEEQLALVADTEWWIGQVVLMAKDGFESVTTSYLATPWLEECEERVQRQLGRAPSRPEIRCAETASFLVFALVARLP